LGESIAGLVPPDDKTTIQHPDIQQQFLELLKKYLEGNDYSSFAGARHFTITDAL